MKLVIGHLYGDQLNIYGDRGNILTLYRRCQWRNIDVEIRQLNIGDAIDPDVFDLYFMGGGQDAQQLKIVEDLQRLKAEPLRQAARENAVFLTICGGYQLLGHYYKPHQGPEIKGISIIDAHTVAGNRRFIGNVSIRRNDPQGREYTIVGFENHSGLTYLGQGVTPLGRVLTGYGNNGEDGYEGAVAGSIYGTYLHGSLLPKNPTLADELIIKALSRRYGTVTLEPLDDATETLAHERALSLK